MVIQNCHLKWDLIFFVYSGHAPNVFHRDRLPAPGIIRYRKHAKRDIRFTNILDKYSQFIEIHIPFEKIARIRIEGFFDNQVRRSSPFRTDIAFGGIEMHIRGYVLPFLQRD